MLFIIISKLYFSGINSNNLNNHNYPNNHNSRDLTKNHCWLEELLFIHSYGSQKIMDSTLSVGDDIYQIDKNYLFILMRTQRLLKIKAGFIHAYLPTFQMILSWTVSLVTLIESFV